MKALRIIIALTLLGFAIMLGIYLQMPKAVLSVVGGPHMLTELRLYDDGSFTIKCIFLLGTKKTLWESDHSEHFSGSYLVKDDRVLLFADTTFDASQEAAKLSRFRGQEWIRFESRSNDFGTRAIEGEHRPKWLR